MRSDSATLVDVLRRAAGDVPQSTAFAFIDEEGRDGAPLTYAQLDLRARALAHQIQERCGSNTRVLLLLPPGLDYVCALFACFYAGMVAVPCYPPAPNRSLARLGDLVRDCDARLVVASADLTPSVGAGRGVGAALAGLDVILMHDLDEADAHGWREDPGGADRIALLQYSSGTTGVPKGVVLDHGNLLANLASIGDAFGCGEGERAVSWLPPYHDMGLIGTLLMPVYLRAATTLMSPASFVRRPLRWLRAISQCGATISGGPDFAFELCARRARAAEIEALDLRRWRVAFTGAETVRQDTLERFARTFAPAGFRAEAFLPCYGLAEASLLVSGSASSRRPRVKRVDASSLQHGRIETPESGTRRVRELVSCGRPGRDTRISIVDAQGGAAPPGRVGEIWVASRSVARGYWQRPELTESTFPRAAVDGGEPDTWLRTGDLGFLDEGELFVAGRIKDLLVIDGRNIHPDDVERTLQAAHQTVSGRDCAVFAIEAGGRERMAAMIAVGRGVAPGEAVFQALRRGVAEAHEVELHAVSLVRERLPRTTSGKLRRHACREAFEGVGLGEVARFEAAARNGGSPPSPDLPAPVADPSEAPLVQWMVRAVAARSGLPPSEVDPRRPLVDFGIGSRASLELLGELEERLGRALAPTVLWEFPTIAALARHLAAGAASSPLAGPVPQEEATGSASAIAVVGMGCRFPDAEDPDAFWRLLCDGRVTAGPVPAGRWESAAVAGVDPGRQRPASFVDGVEAFDARFFGIAPREARAMDPQQRLLLEVSWEALEHAGCAPDGLENTRTGVFVGIGPGEYAQACRIGEGAIDVYTGTGSMPSVAAGRLSYVLGLRGPCLAVDTACSSSLAAVHLACESLRRGESDLALAGGVSLMLSPLGGIALGELGALSPDGLCKPFDDRADGYGRGEGCGIVVLRRLADARRDGDRVLAVLPASALNHDGQSNGLTAPSVSAQRDVLTAALSQGGRRPADVELLETHGTGTTLGDAIEIDAARAVLCEERDPRRPLRLGAVKANIGHLEAAAGIAGLIKVLLCLEHDAVPGQPGLESLNAHVPWEALPIEVPRSLTPWPARDTPRLAGVSAFGLSGTNVHVIVEEAPPIAPPAAAPPTHGVVCLSARTPEALARLRAHTASRLAADPQMPLADLCRSANAGRAHFEWRLAVVAGDTQGIRARLSDGADPDLFEAQRACRSEPLVNLSLVQAEDLVDPRALLPALPALDAVMAECDAALRRCLSMSVSELLATTRQAFPAARGVVLGVAWTRALQALGVSPGRILGGVAAACARGDLDLDHALAAATGESAGDGAVGNAGSPGIHAEAARALWLCAGDLPGSDAEGTRVALPTCHDDAPQRTLARLLGALYVAGARLDWRRLSPGRVVSLPTYPFQRERYWIDAPPSTSASFPSQPADSPLLGRRLDAPGLAQTLYESRCAAAAQPWLADHRVRGELVVPAAQYLAMAWAASADRAPVRLTQVVFPRPLALRDDESVPLQLVCSPREEGALIEIAVPGHARDGDTGRWQVHARARLGPAPGAIGPVPWAAAVEPGDEEIDAPTLYAGFEGHEVRFGPSFRWIRSLRRGGDACVASIVPPESLSPDAARLEPAHPGLIDAAFQVLGAAAGERVDAGALVPASIGDALLAPLDGRRVARVLARVTGRQQGITGEVCVLDEAGEALMWLREVSLRPARPTASPRRDWLYRIDWSPRGRVGSRGERPPPAVSTAAIRDRAAAVAPDAALIAHARALPALEAAASDFACAALAILSPATDAGAPLPSAVDLGVLPQRRRLFERLRGMLAEDGVLEAVESGWRWCRPPVPAATLDGLRQAHPEVSGEIDLLERCGPRLVAVLRGEADPLEVLFPGGDDALVARVYGDSPGARAMNALVAEAAASALAAEIPGRRLRVLEIGAGTGGTTAGLLERLPPGTVDYTFSDVSPLLVERARARFGERRDVRFRVLDVQAPGDALEEPGFDLVVAANVLHATADLCHSLREVHRLLVPGGTLVLLEGTRRLRWLDLIFGLTEGWWSFEDRALRPDHPLLTASGWRTALGACGFEACDAVAPRVNGEDAPQSVVVARRPRAPTRCAGTGASPEPRFLVLCASPDDGEALARALGDAGARAVCGPPSGIAESLAADAEPPSSVVYLADTGASGTLPEQARAQAADLLAAVRRLLAARPSPPPRLWLLTRGAQPVPEAPSAAGLAQAPLLGLAKVVALEHPELRCTRIDLDPARPVHEMRMLADELLAADPEDEVAFRDDLRLHARVRPAAALEPAAGHRLDLAARGSLTGLRRVPAAPREPGPGEVCIAVAATGVNFRDVLNVLGLYPGAPPLGSELAGEVVAVGPAASGSGDGSGEARALAPGDTVVGLCPDAFDDHVTVPSSTVLRLPPGLSAEAGATLPVAFLTADVALDALAGLERGQRVLIHAAAGGVGQAAVQLARARGAEIVATASAGKWETLRSQGIEDIFDSRSGGFAAALRERCRGVNVVLNCLTGERIAESLEVLEPGGVFIELGKRGTWTPEAIAAVRPDVEYHVLDLAQRCVDEPLAMRARLAALLSRVAAGELRPLPHRSFDVAEIQDAFRHLERGHNIGKVVVRHPGVDGSAAAVPVREDAAYAVVGGLGGLGRLVARWLAAQGARDIVLIGRGAPGTDAEADLKALRGSGTRVRVLRCDASDGEALGAALADVRRQGPPLAGVIHAAGVLDDAVVAGLSDEALDRVLRPKVDAAWHLHTHTAQDPLDFFVLFSSAAALAGSPGQANHAAANCFLDRLAAWRRAQGLPARSIAWGPWSDVGAAAERGFGAAGTAEGTIAPAQGLALLPELLRGATPDVAVVPFAWSRFCDAAAPLPLLCEVLAEAEVRGAAAAAARLELEGVSRAQGRRLLTDLVREEVSRVLGMGSAAEVDLEEGFFDLGMDSLTSVELRNRLQRRLGRELPSTVAFDFPTVGGLVDHICEDLLPADGAGEVTTAAEVEPARVVDGPVPPAPAGGALPVDGDAIAIVGMGCRLPGGSDGPAAYWAALCEGRDGITEVPATRWDVDAFYDPDPEAPGKMVTRFGGFIAGPERFDADFFGVSRREAISMDPQQRLLLEVSWQALEDAALAPESLAGSNTGVFVGICSSDYARLLATRAVEDIDAYLATGNAHSVAAGRLSHLLGLKGPSLAVDTACSSSLVSVHMACASLRGGECDVALAGGVNLVLVPEYGINFSKARMLAPDGRCKVFDAAADGFVRAEGAGMVVLKSLARARRDGDRIHAVILGSAVNQDGRSSGLTVPNGPSQEAVMREALARADVDPGVVGYVEAHGTGTALGDPIEAGSLAAVFPGRARACPLQVGSVKSNLGHLEGAAGIAGLIKTALVLRNGAIPPNLHFHTLNPRIAEAAAFEVPTRLTPWPEGAPRVAGVSSFGFSGTNAHAVLAAAPEAPTGVSAGPRVGPALLPLSAKTPEALDALTRDVSAFLAASPEIAIEDAFFTASAGRSQFRHRLSLRGDAATIRAGLSAIVAGRDGTSVRRSGPERGEPPRVAFLFSGQGTQYAGMGAELHRTQPAFREAIERCDAILRPVLPRPLLEVLDYADGGAPGADDPLEDAALLQPALFSVEYALAQMWRAFGIVPEMVMGHSLGEFAAACDAGVLSLEAALPLVAARGRLIQALPERGTMAAVAADEATTRATIAASGDPSVCIAAVNAPRQTVIAGPAAAVTAVSQALAAREVVVRPLPVTHAFHSGLMAPAAGALAEAAGGIATGRARCGLVSNVTGAVVVDEMADPAYWSRHLLAPVRFAQGLRALRTAGCTTFIEIGPRPALLGTGAAVLDEPGLHWLPSLRPPEAVWDTLTAGVETLYHLGAAVDFRAAHAGHGRRPCALPGYPFQRQRFWPADTGGGVVAPAPRRDRGTDPLLGERRSSPLASAVFETRQATPGSWEARHVARALGAARIVDSGVDLLEAFAIEAAPEVMTAFPVEVHSVVHEEAAGRWGIEIFARPVLESESGWTRCATARARRARPQPEVPPVLREDLPVADASGWGLSDLRHAAGTASARARLDGEAGELEAALLRAAVAVLAAAGDLPAPPPGESPATLIALDEARWIAALPAEVELRARRTDAKDAGAARVVGEVDVLGADGEPVARLVGVRLQAVEDPHASWRYIVDWPAMARRGERLPPTFLPSATALGASVSRALSRSAEALDLPRYALALDALDDAAGDLTALALWPDGVPDPGTEVTTQGLARATGLAPDHTRWFRRLLEVAARAGLLEPVDPEATRWRVRRAPRGASPTEVLDTLAVEHPQVTLEQALLRRCGLRLRDTLAGRCDAVELLFPDGDASEATALYQDTLGAQAMNRAVREAVTAAVDAAPAHRLVRILEIGAGTGGTTASLLPHLPGHRVEYVFTDVSTWFLGQAAERFRAHAGVHYQRLDIEQPPERQGFDPGSFDIIVAANVLHATRDLDAAVAHVRRLLAPGGQLVLLEGTEPQAWLDLIFGATEGWWRFDDRRVAHPLLPASAWEALLGEADFGDVVVIEPPTGDDRPAPQAVLLARGPAAPAAASPARHWLLAAPDIDDGELAVKLEGAGDRCTRLSLPEDAVEAGRALEVVLAEATPPVDGIVVLPGSDPGDEGMRTGADALARARRGCAGALAVVQALIAAEHAVPVWLLTRGAQAVRGDEPVPGVAQSALWGLGRVLAVEHPELASRLVDLDVAGEAFPEPLIEELRHGGDDDQIAFRGEARHAARLVRAPVLERGVLPVRPDRSYLITGGMGGLGLATAQRLVERGARHLVLAGRRPPDAAAQGRVDALRRRGCAVDVRALDVGDDDAVACLLAGIAAGPAPLAGVMHAAGGLDDGLLRHLTPDRFTGVMAAKVAGAWALHRHTVDAHLDFFVLFSSAAALLGSPGQANHAAANAFMDALAAHRQAQGCAATSIAWGVWGDTGAAVREAADGRLQQHGIGAIPTQAGLETLESVVVQGMAHVGVVPVDWAILARQLGGRRYLEALTDDVASEPEPTGAFLDTLRETPVAERRERLLAHVQEQVGAVLGGEGGALPAVDVGFFELGMDSLTSVELKNRLHRSLGCSLSATAAFDHPTIAAIVTHLIEDRLPVEFDGPAPAAEHPESADATGELDDLDEDALAELLAGKLAALKDGRGP